MIESPCNDICTTDPESGLCVGCGRTQQEIANWTIFSEQMKKKVIKNLKTRNNIDSACVLVLIRLAFDSF